MSKTIFEVIPTRSLGPVLLGVHQSEVKKVLGTASDTQEPYSMEIPLSNDAINFPRKDYYFKNALQISYDEKDNVEYIEVTQTKSFTILFQEVKLLEISSKDAIKHMSTIAKVNTDLDEYPETCVYFDISLSLWKPSNTNKKFKTLGIGIKKYYQDILDLD